jgi:hypothetical protein
LKNFLLQLTFFLVCNAAFAQPVINSFVPTKGPVGTPVIITGSGFSATPANNLVYFGAVKATVTAASANSLTVLAPAGATYQPITVTVGTQIGYSQLFFSLTFPSGNIIHQDNFSVPVVSTVGSQPYGLAMADFNGDGKNDLATTNRNSHTVSILKNLSVDDSIEFATKIDITAENTPYDITTADFNGDGKLDIVVTNFNAASISYFMNESTQANIAFGAKNTIATGTQPTKVQCGDVDKDGKIDIVVANNLSKTVTIIRNTSVGATTSFAPKFDLTFEGYVACIALADFNGDGKIDLAGSDNRHYDGRLFICKNNSTPGTASFDFANRFDTAFGEHIHQLHLGDFNNDGKLDLTLGNAFGLSAFMLNNCGNDSLDFDYTWDYGAINANNELKENMSVGDLNGDGQIDITAHSNLFNHVKLITFFSNPNEPACQFHSLGEYPAGVPYPVQDFIYFQQSVVGDVNGDGKPEIAIAGEAQDIVAVYKNKFLPGPEATSFSPTTASTGDTLTIIGTNFRGSETIQIGDRNAAEVLFVSPTSIRAIVEEGNSGEILITNFHGNDTLGGFTFVPKVPQIDRIDPPFGTEHQGINIFGKHFLQATSVKFGGIPAAGFSIENPYHIIAIPSQAGTTGAITVANVTGEDTLLGYTHYFTPIVTSFSPTTANNGDTITIRGKYFVNLDLVQFGGTAAPAFQLLNDSTIKAVVGLGGTGDVSVSNTAIGIWGALPGFTFEPILPTITSFSPMAGKTGDTITISGTNLNTTTAVSFGTMAAASYWAVSPTQLKAIISNGASGDVVLSNNLGSNTLAGFTYIEPPIITSFSPATGDSGTIVIITGSNFNGATSVKFGGTAATSFVVNNPTTITAVLNNGTTGNISVTTPTGTAQLGTFTVFPYVDSTSVTLCHNGGAAIVSNFSATTYQWQVSSGGAFTNMANSTFYSGVTTNTLQISNMPSTFYGYKYRCRLNGTGYSNKTTIKFENIWTGAVSTAWENPANWSCSILPNVNTDVVIPPGSEVIANTNNTIRSLTVGSGATYTVNPPNNITILGANAATGSLTGAPGSCASFLINGTYAQEIALTAANTVQVQVNVTAAGPYAITTNTVGGVNFYKAGVFTTAGVQTVVLQGNGTPGLSGNRTFTVNFGTSNCSFVINFTAAALNYIPTTLNNFWSYAATSTPNPVDSLYKISLPNFYQANGNTYREMLEASEFHLLNNAGYRKNGTNYFFNYNQFDDTHSIVLLDINGEIKQLDDAAPVGSTWISNVTGWVNGGSLNTPLRVQGSILAKGVSASLPTGLSFSNVIKVKLDFFDVTIPATPSYVYSEERWFAFGVGLIYYKSSDPFGTGIIYQLKRYQVY